MFSYRRWRHTRGYGVHSPFAFQLVSDILRLQNRYSYYGYRSIEREMSANLHSRNPEKYTRKAEKEAKLFLRLVAFLNPGSIYLPHSSEYRLLHIAAKQADSRIKIFTSDKNLDKCRMICATTDSLSSERLMEHIRRPEAILFLKGDDPALIKKLFDSLPEGLLLQGTHHAIFIHRRGMMKLSYSIIL